jgi:hypothetical protein
MVEIEKLIKEDDEWKNICLFDSDTNLTCADNPSKGKTALATPSSIFHTLYGQDLSEIT